MHDEPYDHGWDMPDTRASYWFTDPDSWVWYDDIPEPQRVPLHVGNDDYGEYTDSIGISVRVKRTWHSRYEDDDDGYRDEDSFTYGCTYEVIVGGAVECAFNKPGKAEAYIAAAYPGATYDDDAFRERQAAARGRPY